MTGLDSEFEKITIKSREELLEECLEIGIPVTGYEDQETLEMFLGSADDDDFDDEDNEDEDFDDEFEDEDEIGEPAEDDEIFDEDFDFEEDEDEDLFEDDETSYN